jgi:predicted PurR-regulated permease PerM
MMNVRKPIRRLYVDARAIGWAVACVGAVLLLAFAAEAVFVVFAGLLLSVFLGTLAHWITRHTPLPYWAALMLLVLAGLGATALTLVLAGPSLAEQMARLQEQLPHALQAAVKRVRVWAYGTLGVAPEQLQQAPRAMAAGAGGALMSSARFIAGAIVAGFVGLYGAANPGAYVRGAMALVPPERRHRAEQVTHELGRRLGRWLVGRAISMLIIGLSSAIALSILRVPLAISLGILAGLLTFVEYLGAVVSSIPPILLAFTESPMKALWVAVLFTAIHVVDGYMITPLIVRTAVRFPPAFTLSMQAIFGALFGVIGVTFATPAAIVGATLIEKLYVEDRLRAREGRPPG